jgi:hypothetical protein
MVHVSNPTTGPGVSATLPLGSFLHHLLEVLAPALDELVHLVPVHDVGDVVEAQQVGLFTPGGVRLVTWLSSVGDGYWLSSSGVITAK